MPYDKTKNIINTHAKEKMSTRRTRQSRAIKAVDINLTDIKFNSTCISLNIPLMLCCNNCKPKVESILQDVVIEEKKLLERYNVVAVINNNYNYRARACDVDNFENMIVEDYYYYLELEPQTDCIRVISK